MLVTIIVAGLIPLGGCRICADCEDLAYPAYGGAWQRTRRDTGRVGSLFDPGGARSSELVSRDTPEHPDMLERQRQDERSDETDEEKKLRQEEEARELEESDPDDEPQDTEADIERKEDELRNKKLEDIELEDEDEMRKKTLDEINIRIVPGQPTPPIIQ
ncbi:MAG: hypothetical protein AB8B91_02470 [Rubripirellula sp.]